MILYTHIILQIHTDSDVYSVQMAVWLVEFKCIQTLEKCLNMNKALINHQSLSDSNLQLKDMLCDISMQDCFIMITFTDNAIRLDVYCAYDTRWHGCNPCCMFSSEINAVLLQAIELTPHIHYAHMENVQDSSYTAYKLLSGNLITCVHTVMFRYTAWPTCNKQIQPMSNLD